MARFPEVPEKHYIGEVGTNILINCGIDVSDATATRYDVKKPDGTVDTWAALPFTYLGSPNYLLYTLLEEDFDQAGVYFINPFAELPSGWQGVGTTVSFNVYNLYE